VQLLLNIPIPGYVNRLAGLGAMVSCLMPQGITGQAPVGDGSGSSSSSSSTPKTYSGAGYKTGSTGNTGSTTEQLSPEGLNDRRERVRAAALRRTSQE